MNLYPTDTGFFMRLQNPDYCLYKVKMYKCEPILTIAKILNMFFVRYENIFPF